MNFLTDLKLWSRFFLELALVLAFIDAQIFCWVYPAYTGHLGIYGLTIPISVSLSVVFATLAEAR